MKKKNIYAEDIERIVNDPERQQKIDEFHTERMAKRQRKMLLRSVAHATLAIIFAILGLLSWMTPWIAYPMLAICGLVAAFNFGRWFENGKVYGWM